MSHVLSSTHAHMKHTSLTHTVHATCHSPRRRKKFVYVPHYDTYTYDTHYAYTRTVLVGTRCNCAHISCNTLQHTATHCNTLQHTATHCNTLQHTATHYNTLQHTTTHCNTLQRTATHYNTLQHTATHSETRYSHTHQNI